MDIFAMGAELAAKCQHGELTRADLMQLSYEFLVKSMRSENAEERARLLDMAVAYDYARHLTR